MEFDALNAEGKEETSAQIRDRVIAAREIQYKRYKGTGITCNARLTPKLLKQYCKMTEDALGDVMHAMADGDIQVLVCTTIIETGLDIPNANTLIIENADRLQHSIKEHQEIFNAMAAKNPNLAAQLTSDHIEKAKEHMITRFNYNG
mgnify:CR=1 FL=1